MDKRILVAIGSIVVLAGLIILARFLMKPSDDCVKLIFDVNPHTMIIGNESTIKYNDRTPGAESWHWDFGDNKGKSDEQTGSYTYDDAGKYLIKLTVNNKCIDTLTVWVKSLEVDTDKVKVEIIAPQEGRVGESISFKGVADGANEWNWKFGESGQIDDKTQNPSHTFLQPNVYSVVLLTDAAKKPAVHTITILPKPRPANTEKPKPEVKPKEKPTPGTKPAPPPPPPSTGGIPSASEIKEVLQKIANAGDYTKDDREWVSANFIKGKSTPVKVSPADDNILSLDDLITEMELNPGNINIISVTPKSEHNFISQLTVTISRKK